VIFVSHELEDRCIVDEPTTSANLLYSGTSVWGRDVLSSQLKNFSDVDVEMSSQDRRKSLHSEGVAYSGVGLETSSRQLYDCSLRCSSNVNTTQQSEDCTVLSGTSVSRCCCEAVRGKMPTMGNEIFHVVTMSQVPSTSGQGDASCCRSEDVLVVVY